jgi:hypothetical protein
MEEVHRTFDDFDNNEWPVLHKQLRNTTSIYDEFDKVFEDYKQLGWEDLLAPLTKPRSDPSKSIY